MPFVSACGLDVHYVAHGPGPDADPPTAVLLHGFTPDHRLMTGAFEPVFTARERRPGGVAWRRLYLDLPGMGRTRSAAHVTGTDVVLDVVREVVDRLVPDGRVALCGQSYGGYLARGIVASTPGSVVYETAASSHTPQASDSTGDVIALNIVSGDLVYLDDNDRVVAVENWKTALDRYLAYCEANGMTPRDLTAFH